MKTKTKKILVTSNLAWNLANFRMSLVTLLQQRGFNVVTAAVSDAYVQKIEKEVRFIPLRFLRRGGMNPLLEIALFFEYLFLYRKEKPEVVLNFTIKPNIYSSLACSLLGIPVVSTVTGLGYAFSKPGLVQHLTKFLYKVSLRRNRNVVFQNEDNRRFFLEQGLVLPGRDVLIEGSGVDTEYFSSVTCPMKSHEGIVFLMIARLLRDKGVYEFVEAAQRIQLDYPNTRFILLGNLDKENPSSVTKEELQHWQLQSNIEYAGNVDDVRPYVCASDVVVLPSYHEGLSKSLLEAMSMERPIIASDIPGCRPLVNEGVNGFLVPIKNTQVLEDAMKHMINRSANERRTMGEAGRKLVLERFDQKIILDRYIGLVADILKN